MEMVLIVIGRQFVGFPVNFKNALGDAVSIAPHNGTEIRSNGDLIFQLVITQDDISHPAIPVWCPEFGDDCAIIYDLYDHSIIIG